MGHSKIQLSLRIPWGGGGEGGRGSNLFMLEIPRPTRDKNDKYLNLSSRAEVRLFYGVCEFLRSLLVIKPYYSFKTTRA